MTPLVLRAVTACPTDSVVIRVTSPISCAVAGVPIRARARATSAAPGPQRSRQVSTASWKRVPAPASPEPAPPAASSPSPSPSPCPPPAPAPSASPHPHPSSPPLSSSNACTSSGFPPVRSFNRGASRRARTAPTRWAASVRMPSTDSGPMRSRVQLRCGSNAELTEGTPGTGCSGSETTIMTGARSSLRTAYSRQSRDSRSL